MNSDFLFLVVRLMTACGLSFVFGWMVKLELQYLATDLAPMRIVYLSVILLIMFIARKLSLFSLFLEILKNFYVLLKKQKR
ncbi:hypothetical protein [Paenibacillus terrigena]|uniref:hypothetical protein n=1 Tax=Paenibacillus terrigena TaxID=369333 RepID=UPI00036EDDFA|nr:hypothetical protein [Paenibacillus terrigena]